jgi:thiol:disulfide interchange protein
MPVVHGLLNLIMLAVTIWCYWRILNKAGLNPWWAYALLVSLAIAYLTSILQSPVVLFAPYIVPAVLIWIFAYIRWPSYEKSPGADEPNRYMPYQYKRSDVAPSADPHRTVNPKFGDAAADRDGRPRPGKKQ